MVDRTPRRLCLSHPHHWGQFLWGGDKSVFDQVTGQTDLEVILEKTQKNCVGLISTPNDYLVKVVDDVATKVSLCGS